MSRPWLLKLALLGPDGEKYDMAISLGNDVIDSYVCVPPPDMSLVQFGLGTSFNEAVEIMRRRDLRRDLFAQECARIGLLLAHRMEDKEGWHGVERKENLKDWG
jgi:hypothetical protein